MRRYFKRFFRRMGLKLYIRFKSISRTKMSLVDENEIKSSAICRRLISHPDSTFLIAPLSHKRYIRNEPLGMFIVLSDKRINITNHVYNYDVNLSDVVADKFNITTPLRLSHFLAQCGHERGGFKAVQENVNYSADGLKKIFGKYFPGNMADLYARKPEKIASRVYASRMGNGDESTREGFLFRGRGYIQLTGKSNYTNFSKFIGEDCVVNPDLVANKYPLASAAFFFDSNKLWSICDKGSDLETVTAVTKRVNGGTIGLTDRVSEFNKIYAILKE